MIVTIDTTLRKLFDFQLYQNNDKLQKVIDSTLAAGEFGRELSDNEVELFAAGDPNTEFYNLVESDDE